MDKYTTLHELLVKLFNDILNIEQKAIATGDFKDLTTNEIHVIEAIGPDTRKNMSAIAKDLKVTVGSLTTAVNVLLKKGYVSRERGEQDRRVVHVMLTEKGDRLFERHMEFHENMIDSVLKELDEEESQVLIKALTGLMDFFRQCDF